MYAADAVAALQIWSRNVSRFACCELRENDLNRDQRRKRRQTFDECDILFNDRCGENRSDRDDEDKIKDIELRQRALARQPQHHDECEKAQGCQLDGSSDEIPAVEEERGMLWAGSLLDEK